MASDPSPLERAGVRDQAWIDSCRMWQVCSKGHPINALFQKTWWSVCLGVCAYVCVCIWGHPWILVYPSFEVEQDWCSGHLVVCLQEVTLNFERHRSLLVRLEAPCGSRRTCRDWECPIDSHVPPWGWLEAWPPGPDWLVCSSTNLLWQGAATETSPSVLGLRDPNPNVSEKLCDLSCQRWQAPETVIETFAAMYSHQVLSLSTQLFLKKKIQRFACTDSKSQ